MVDCTPNFTPSPTSCEMPTKNEIRSRRKIGGTLFRSIDTGPDTNNISVEGIWFVCVNGTVSCSISGVDIRPYDSNIDNFCNVVAFELVVYNSSIEVERYRIGQSVDCGSPITWTSGIPALRSMLASSSSYVVLPNLDAQTTGGGNNNTWDAGIDDSDHLNQFALSPLVGGTGLNNMPLQSELDGIRTGPTFTLVNIGQSEIQNADGSITSLNQPVYWNGGCWKTFDSINPILTCDFDPTCP